MWLIRMTIYMVSSSICLAPIHIYVHHVHRDKTQTYAWFDVTCAHHSILLTNKRSILFTNSVEDLGVYFWLQFCRQKYDTDRPVRLKKSVGRFCCQKIHFVCLFAHILFLFFSFWLHKTLDWMNFQICTRLKKSAKKKRLS